MCSKYPLKRLPEFRVENRVYDRVERWIRVAQPCEYLECDVWYTGLAEGRHNVYAEERHPADEENTHDDAHGDSGFVVADVVRWTMVVLHVDVESLVALFDALLGVLDGVRKVKRSGHSPDVLYMLLGIAV